MERYYFDVDDGELEHEDEEGLLFSGPAEMRTEAMHLLPDIARELSLADEDRSLSVYVRDGNGAVVFTASLTIRAEWIASSAQPEILRAALPRKRASLALVAGSDIVA